MVLFFSRVIDDIIYDQMNILPDSIKYIKAYMKWYKQRETAAIFLYRTFIENGINEVYVMVDFICMDLLKQHGTQRKREIYTKWYSGIRTWYISHTNPLIYQLRHDTLYPRSFKI